MSSILKQLQANDSTILKSSSICGIIGESVDTKHNKEVVTLDFVDQNCNCNDDSKI